MGALLRRWLFASMPPIASVEDWHRESAANNSRFAALLFTLAPLFGWLHPGLSWPLALCFVLWGARQSAGSLRCPECDDPWRRRIWSSTPRRDWRETITSLTQCPACGYAPPEQVAAPPRDRELQDALDEAWHAAKAEKQGLVTEAHLLFGLSHCRSVREALSAVGVSGDEVEAFARSQVELVRRGLIAGAPPEPSAGVIDVLIEASSEAVRGAWPLIPPQLVLLALLRSQEGGELGAGLVELGVDRSRLLAHFARD